MMANSTNGSPRISIGLPVYNGAEYLAQAIESVLSQTVADLELIIGDNASTDDTALICKLYAEQDRRIVYRRHDINMGAARNFNYVAEAAKGEYFAWLAHDDVMADTYLEKCLATLVREPLAVLCFAKTKIIDAAGEVVGDYTYDVEVTADDPANRFLSMMSSDHIVVEAFGLVRREVLLKTSMMQSFMGSDVVMLSELLLQGKFLELPEFLFYHREHPNRSVYAHADPRDRTKWFDTRKSSRFVLPHWRMLFEHARVAIKCGLGIGDKARLLYGVLKAARWRADVLLRELVGAWQGAIGGRAR